jgi:O-antigen ligase
MGSLESLKKISYLGPALWVASIPYGPSISSIFFVLGLLSFLIQRPHQQALIAQLKAPWSIAIILLITWTLFSLVWAPDFNHDTWSNVKKVLRLLLIPLLLMGLQDQRQKDIAFNGFILGMVITSFLSGIKFVFHYNIHHDSDAGHVFYNHIITGFFGVYAAFCSLYFYFEKKSHSYWYLIAFILLSIEVLVINPGRAPYILYPLLIIPYVWFKFSNQLRWIVSLIGLALIIIIFQMSSTFQSRLSETLNDIQTLHQGQKSTSIGFRMQFYQFSNFLFQKHIWIGNGPGSYFYFFKLLNPVPAWQGPPNPHSQYWLILVEEGIIGLALWGYAFFQFFKHMNALGRAYLLLLLINCFSDVIFYSCPGQLFLGIAALTLCKGQQK